MYGSRRKISIRQLESAADEMDIAPHFGIESTAPRVKNTNDLPLRTAKADGISKSQSGIRGRRILADD